MNKFILVSHVVKLNRFILVLLSEIGLGDHSDEG